MSGRPVALPLLPVSRQDLSSVQLESSPIIITASYLTALDGLVHSHEELRKAGYVMACLDQSQIESKARCQICSKPANRIGRKRPNLPSPNTTKPRESGAADEGSQKVTAMLIHQHNLTEELRNQVLATLDLTWPSHAAIANKIMAIPITTKHDATQVKPSSHTIAGPSPATLFCRFHCGRPDKANRRWSCCYKRLSEPACSGFSEHTPISYGPRGLLERYQYQQTPVWGSSYPPPRAVALDCEMGTAKDGETELIRVTLLDYSSGKVLLDSLVYPDVSMAHFNTRYSGITRDKMNQARRNRDCLFGRKKALSAVWRFVAPETIVIGHSVNNDLKSLRWIHFKVIDTFLLEPKPIEPDASVEATPAKDNEDSPLAQRCEPGPPPPAASDTIGLAKPQQSNSKTPKGSGARALKTLARVKLGREIQSAGRLGHDSYEDALAARDLVHWAVTHM